MRQKLSTYLEQLIEYCWLVAAIVLPIMFNPWGASPFELAKSLVLMTLAIVLVACSLLYHVVSGKGRSGSELSLLWAALCCCLAGAAATVLATSLEDSLFGTLERRQGLITQLSYIVLMLSVVLHLRTMNQVQRIFQAMAWASLPLCVFGLMQALGFNPFDWTTDSNSAVMATLGRSNFFGSYLVLVLPLTLVLTVISGRWWILVAGLQLACLLFTQARSSWLGLVGATVTWLVLCRIKPGKQSSVHPRYLLLLPVTVVGYVIMSFLADHYQFDPPIGYTWLTEAIFSHGGSFAARLTIWQRSAELLLEQLWLGHGFDSMGSVFARSFPPELVYYQGRHVMVDRAHNIWLDLGMSSGVLGIVAFTALLVLLGRRVYAGLHSTGGRPAYLYLVGVTAALVGHLVDLIFSFDLTATAALFWLLLGLAGGLSRGRLPDDPEPAEALASRGFQIAFFLLVFLVVFGGLGKDALQADCLFKRAQQRSRSLDDNRADMEQAVAYQPRQPDYRMYLAQLVAADGDLITAERYLQATWRQRPNDPWIMVQRGNLYAQTGSAHHLTIAEQSYRWTIELAPDIGTFHTALAILLLRQGRPVEALDELKEALRLDETDGVAYGHLARAHALLGHRTEAIEAGHRAEKWGRHERIKVTP